MAEETTASNKKRLPDGYTGHLVEQGSATTALRDAYSKSLSEKNTEIKTLNGELDVEYVGGEFSEIVSKVESGIDKGEIVDLSKLEEKELKAIKTSLKYLNESNAVIQMAGRIIRMNAGQGDHAWSKIPYQQASPF
jgi:hypothetical protein